MTKGILLCSLVLHIVSAIAFGQPLKTGDVVPDKEISHVYNYSSDKIRLSQFRKKYIILDFWETNCLGCLKSFKKIDSLQKQFNQDIQILLINQSTRDSTKRFFETHKKVHQPAIPFITNDTRFQALFPHQGKPYYVVLDSAGKVVSMPKHLYPSSITALLTKKEASLVQTNKRVLLKSFLAEELKGLVLSGSVLYRTTDGLRISLPVDTSLAHASFSRQSVSQLYGIAYSDSKDGIFFPFTRPGRTVVEARNPGDYIAPANSEAYAEWSQANAYDYLMFYPKRLGINKYDVIKDDLRRAFHMAVSVEKRKVKCLTLIRTSAKDKVRSKGGEKVDNFHVSSLKESQTDSLKIYQNSDYKTFSNRLRSIVEYFLKQPFHDATGFPPHKLISLHIDGQAIDSLDIKAIKIELNKYGLDLVEKEWVMDILVLREEKRK